LQSNATTEPTSVTQDSTDTISRAECFLVSVGDLADGELARRLLRRLSSGVDDRSCCDLLEPTSFRTVPSLWTT